MLLQLIKALNEWSNGTHIDLSTLEGISLQHYDTLKNRLLRDLNTFKHDQPDTWINFSLSILNSSCSYVTSHTATTTAPILQLFNPVTG